MELQQAIDLLKANGYRVTRPARKVEPLTRPKFNCLGLPMSPLYDPNYRMKHKLPSIARLYAPQNFRWVAN